jgi:hypothetical protein
MEEVTGGGPSELDSFFADVNVVQTNLSIVKVYCLHLLNVMWMWMGFD